MMPSNYSWSGTVMSRCLGNGHHRVVAATARFSAMLLRTSIFALAAGVMDTMITRRILVYLRPSRLAASR